MLCREGLGYDTITVIMLLEKTLRFMKTRFSLAQYNILYSSDRSREHFFDARVGHCISGKQSIMFLQFISSTGHWCCGARLGTVEKRRNVQPSQMPTAAFESEADRAQHKLEIYHNIIAAIATLALQ